jgi:hypothetical protein
MGHSIKINGSKLLPSSKIDNVLFLASLFILYIYKTVANTKYSSTRCSNSDSLEVLHCLYQKLPRERSTL